MPALTVQNEITKIPAQSPERVSTCFSGCHFKIQKWVCFTYGLDASQTAAFVMGPGANASACQSFRSSFSIPYSSVVLLDADSVGFQSQTLRGLSLQCRIQGLVCLLWRKNPLFLREMFHIFETPFWLWVNMTRVRFLARLCLCLSYPSQCSSFPFVVEALFI